MTRRFPARRKREVAREELQETQRLLERRTGGLRLLNTGDRHDVELARHTSCLIEQVVKEDKKDG